MKFLRWISMTTFSRDLIQIICLRKIRVAMKEESPAWLPVFVSVSTAAVFAGGIRCFLVVGGGVVVVL